MNVRTSRKSFLTLESVAMTDIVMNLFIFFFISFSLLYTFNPRKESSLGLKLPESRAKSGASGETDLAVSVTASNEIFIGKRRVYPNQLREGLSEALKSSRGGGVVVRADKMTSVEYLVKVLDTAKSLGVKRLGVAVEQA